MHLSKTSERRALLHLLCLRELHCLALPCLVPRPGHMSLIHTNTHLYRHVIYKLLGFTLAMVVAPIGSYFLTVDTIFRGQLPFLLPSAELKTSRQLYVRRRLGGNHGECGLDRICNCGFSGGSE
jgi:hypothetical protein